MSHKICTHTVTGPTRVLLVVSHHFTTVGGHALSAAAIARELSRSGYQVGLLIDPIAIPDLTSGEFVVHPCLYRQGVEGPLFRALDILRVMGNFRYDILVAMDWRAAQQAALAVSVYRPYLIQVLAGGRVQQCPPVALPGIIVFSEELQLALQSVHGISKQYLVLSPGRVDFAQFLREAQSVRLAKDPSFPQRVTRILTISRLACEKAPAIEQLFEQVARVARYQPVDLLVIGDGKARAQLEQSANLIMSAAAGPLNIRFLGGWRVSAQDVLQADMVVGQGRTVIEAVAWGVPAAVCGVDGYFGLLTCNTLPELARTNLTGRFLDWRSDLLADLQALAAYRAVEFPAIRDTCSAMYDVHRSVEGIEEAVARINEDNHGCPVSRRKLAKAYMIQAYTFLGRRITRWHAHFQNHTRD